jgi:hypothetical protein
MLWIHWVGLAFDLSTHNILDWRIERLSKANLCTLTHSDYYSRFHVWNCRSLINGSGPNSQTFRDRKNNKLKWVSSDKIFASIAKIFCLFQPLSVTRLCGVLIWFDVDCHVSRCCSHEHLVSRHLMKGLIGSFWRVETQQWEISNLECRAV